MAVSTGGAGQSGRRKNLDAEINLVPFIDLLSMCICFLLITAVWIEVGTIQVKQSHGTGAAATAANDLEVELKFTRAKVMTVSVKKRGKAVQKATVEDVTSEAFLAKLDQKVRQISGMGNIASAMLTPAQGVPYGDLVSVMDVLRRNKISNLGVVPVREASL